MKVSHFDLWLYEIEQLPSNQIGIIYYCTQITIAITSTAEITHYLH